MRESIPSICVEIYQIPRAYRLRMTFAVYSPMLICMFLGGLDLEACVPGATLWAVKAATERAGMSEGCIDNVGLRHAEEQLARPNRRVAPILRDFALIGCRIEFAEVSEKTSDGRGRLSRPQMNKSPGRSSV
jgi:hypothetical protein